MVWLTLFFITIFGLYDLLLLRAARPRPSLTALLYAGRALCQSLFLALTLRQAGHREHMGGLRRYDSYLLLLSLAVLAYTVWPGAIEWKARRYDWVEG